MFYEGDAVSTQGGETGRIVAEISHGKAGRSLSVGETMEELYMVAFDSGEVRLFLESALTEV